MSGQKRIRCAEYDDPRAQCGACDARILRSGPWHTGGGQKRDLALDIAMAKCVCEIVGKRADGTPLPACEVLNFRYYGGRCAADVRNVEVKS